MRQDPGLRRACLEMDRLAAAIAATTAEPLAPQAVQLERLQRRLGLLRGGRKCPLWLALAGWAAAGALALRVRMGSLRPRRARYRRLPFIRARLWRLPFRRIPAASWKSRRLNQKSKSCGAISRTSTSATA